MAINKEYVPIDNQPTIKPRTVTGIFTRYIAKTLPLAFDESMSYYECLCALLEYINQTIVTDINNVNDGIEELQTFYEELQTYVNDYFKNLDVQEEINNKLDDMVKDGTLEEIINQEIFGQINSDIDNLKKYDKVNQLRNPVLEYMHTIRLSGSSIQGMCADDNYYYIYDYSNRKIFKRSLASNALIDELNVDFGHGNGLTIMNNVLYSADFETRTIRTYDLSTNVLSGISPFETSEIINRGLTKIVGITKSKYPNTLLVSLAGETSNNTKITDMAYFKVDLTNSNAYSEVQLLNPNNINMNGQSVLQDFEYQDGKLYFLNSQPTQIITCDEDENDNFVIENMFTYPTYDVLGIAYGEAEGITILPSSYNGDKTLMIMCQVNRWISSQAKTCKFYCFNLYHQLPETRYGSFYENGSSKQLVQVDANATNYFENGKGSYPFKDLCTAMEFLNNYNGGGQNLQLHAGHYYLQQCRNFKGLLIPYEDGVEITGVGAFINSDIYIGNPNHKCTLDFNDFTVSICKLTIDNADLTSSNTGTRVIQQDSDVRFINVDFTTYSVTELHNSRVTAKFTSVKRLPSGTQIYQARDGSQVFLCNNVIANADVYNDGTSLICSPGRVNNA